MKRVFIQAALPAAALVAISLFAVTITRTPGRSWPFALATAVCLSSWGAIKLRGRRRSRKQCDPFTSPHWRETATPISIPWHSSSTPGDADLTIRRGSGPAAYYFCAEQGASVRVTVETPTERPGICVRIFAPDGERSLREAHREAPGRLSLTLTTPAAGIYYLGIGLLPATGLVEQRFRLTLEGRQTGEAPPSKYQLTGEVDDVATWHPYREAIRHMVALGALRATTTAGGWTFRPDASLSHLELDKALSAIVARSPAGSPAFSVPTGALAGGDATRADVVTTAVKTLEKRRGHVLTPVPIDYRATVAAADPHISRVLHSAEYNGLLRGIIGFRSDWDPGHPVSRGEAAQILSNMTELLTTKHSVTVAGVAQTRPEPGRM